MSKKKTAARRKGRAETLGPTGTKGKLVETIAARLHQAPGVNVRTNVELPPRHGTGGPREIDVLLTSRLVSGYETRIAIECKNLKEPIEAEQIDAFVGKLEYVGIPAQHGVYISTSGYRSGALERAQFAGIKAFVLKGLTDDRLSSAVTTASQFAVITVPEMVSLAITNEVDAADQPAEMLMLYNRPDDELVFAYDLVWRAWIAGELAPTLGEHTIELATGPEWLHVVDRQLQPLIRATALVRVIAFGAVHVGQSEQHALIDAVTQRLERLGAKATFDLPSGPLQLTRLETEEQVEAFLASGGLVAMIRRIQAPRIRHGDVWWPPSERVYMAMAGVARHNLAARQTGDSPASLEGIEGSDIGSVFEPIAPIYGSGAYLDAVREAINGIPRRPRPARDDIS